MNSTETEQWLAAGRRHERLTRLKGHAIASGLEPMNSPPVTVPSAVLARLLGQVVNEHAQELLNFLHPSKPDVSQLYACLRAQTPDVHEPRCWDEPSIYEAFAHDGLLDLTMTEEELAQDRDLS